MLKSVTFAALTLLATLTAADAAIRGTANNQFAIDTMHQTASIPKPRTPPRNPFGPTKVENQGEQLQLACQTGNIKNKCKPDTKFPRGGTRV